MRELFCLRVRCSFQFLAHTRRGKTTPKCFISSWVFHIISRYFKSIDSFYTKLSRQAEEILLIIKNWVRPYAPTGAMRNVDD